MTRCGRNVVAVFLRPKRSYSNIEKVEVMMRRKKKAAVNVNVDSPATLDADSSAPSTTVDAHYPTTRTRDEFVFG